MRSTIIDLLLFRKPEHWLHSPLSPMEITDILSDEVMDRDKVDLVELIDAFANNDHGKYRQYEGKVRASSFIIYESALTRNRKRLETSGDIFSNANGSLIRLRYYIPRQSSVIISFFALLIFMFFMHAYFFLFVAPIAFFFLLRSYSNDMTRQKENLKLLLNATDTIAV